MPPAETHIVVIPSYNTGAALLERTIRKALAYWPRIWLFIDGSTDGSTEAITARAPSLQGLRIFVSDVNRGKGSMAAWAAEEAAKEGVSHFLLMDADGQHPAEAIPVFMEASLAAPEAMILGQPQFGKDAPWIRLAGRQLTIGLTHVETLFGGTGDTLFGLRVYPVAELRTIFKETRRGARRYDFDPEVAVRLYWNGVRPIHLPVPVYYLDKSEGGISHFHYVRDNLRMIALHTRLLPQMFPRIIRLLKLRRQWRTHGKTG